MTDTIDIKFERGTDNESLRERGCGRYGGRYGGDHR